MLQRLRRKFQNKGWKCNLKLKIVRTKPLEVITTQVPRVLCIICQNTIFWMYFQETYFRRLFQPRDTELGASLWWKEDWVIRMIQGRCYFLKITNLTFMILKSWPHLQEPLQFHLLEYVWKKKVPKVSSSHVRWHKLWIIKRNGFVMQM